MAVAGRRDGAKQLSVLGLFGGSSESEGPVALDVQVAGGDEGLTRQIRRSLLLTGALNGIAPPDMTCWRPRAAIRPHPGLRTIRVFYDGAVTITLDGVEAAEVAAPGRARQVSRVRRDRRSRPGLPLLLARPRWPRGPGTEVPDEYATGEIAGTGVMRSTALAGCGRLARLWPCQGRCRPTSRSWPITTPIRSTAASPCHPAPVTFGRMSVSGNQRLNERRLRKIAGFPRGERFDPQELDTVRQRLRRTGVFSAITLQEAETLSPGNTLDVDLPWSNSPPGASGPAPRSRPRTGRWCRPNGCTATCWAGASVCASTGGSRTIGSETNDRDDELTIRLERPATITHHPTPPPMSRPRCPDARGGLRRGPGDVGFRSEPHLQRSPDRRRRRWNTSTRASSTPRAHRLQGPGPADGRDLGPAARIRTTQARASICPPRYALCRIRGHQFRLRALAEDGLSGRSAPMTGSPWRVGAGRVGLWQRACDDAAQTICSSRRGRTVRGHP